MKNLFHLSLVLLLGTHLGWAANTGDPSAVNIKVYGVWASASTDCSSPVEIYTNASPSAVNMVGGPDIGTGNIADGTYHCMIIKMSDSIPFSSSFSSDNGNCVAGTEYTINVFRGGDTSSCPDGTSHTATDGEETPCLYITTAGSSSAANPFSSSTPFLLNNAWVVSGDTTATFVTDFTNKVEDQGTECDVQAPVWDFR